MACAITEPNAPNWPDVAPVGPAQTRTVTPGIAVPLASQLVYKASPKIPMAARAPLAFAIVTAFWGLYLLRFRKYIEALKEFAQYIN